MSGHSVCSARGMNARRKRKDEGRQKVERRREVKSSESTWTLLRIEWAWKWCKCDVNAIWLPLTDQRRASTMKSWWKRREERKINHQSKWDSWCSCNEHLVMVSSEKRKRCKQNTFVRDKRKRVASSLAQGVEHFAVDSHWNCSLPLFALSFNSNWPCCLASDCHWSCMRPR